MTNTGHDVIARGRIRDGLCISDSAEQRVRGHDPTRPSHPRVGAKVHGRRAAVGDGARTWKATCRPDPTRGVDLMRSPLSGDAAGLQRPVIATAVPARPVTGNPVLRGSDVLRAAAVGGDVTHCGPTTGAAAPTGLASAAARACGDNPPPGGRCLAVRDEGGLRRALPQIHVGLMTSGLDGVSARDPRKVFGAVVRVAMSAHRRGWAHIQFINELTGDGRRNRRRPRRLWDQLRAGRTDLAAFRQAHKAWGYAVANVNNVSDRTIEDLRADAMERAYQWDGRISDGHDGLTTTEAAVLGYVIAETQRRRMLRVTCPVRAIADFAKCSTMTASRALNALASRGVLIKHAPGRRSGDPSSRRAAIYELTNPETLPRGGRAATARRRRKSTGT